MATGLAIAGGGLGALGALSSGGSQANSLDAQSQVAQQNASLAIASGEANARRQQMLGNQKIGSEKAGYGASGIDSTQGSALDVIQSSAMNSELDRLNILHGSQVQAINYENQSKIDSTQASGARTASYLGAAASLAGGAAGAMKGGSGTTFNFNQYGSEDDDED